MLRQDEEIMGTIRLAHHWSVIYLAELEHLSDVIDSVLELLEEEAGNG